MASDFSECAGGVAGLCVIRNAVDLVAFLCGHYLGSGFAHLAFVDDGSSDGTFEYLSKIANRTSRVSVRQVHYETFEQQTLMTESANALIAAGYSIIVPFDADEFWNVEVAQFERLSASVREQLFSAKWVNFCPSEKMSSLFAARTFEHGVPGTGGGAREQRERHRALQQLRLPSSNQDRI